MLTEYEQEMVKHAHEGLEQAGQMFEGLGLEVPPEFLSIVIGSMMAAIDAVFAIRDGEAWRGIEDPRGIAAELIRVAHMTDPN
jgi:hypothetical protein